MCQTHLIIIFIDLHVSLIFFFFSLTKNYEHLVHIFFGSETKICQFNSSLIIKTHTSFIKSLNTLVELLILGGN